MATVTQADLDRLVVDMNNLAARIQSTSNRKTLYDLAARVNTWTVPTVTTPATPAITARLLCAVPVTPPTAPAT